MAADLTERKANPLELANLMIEKGYKPDDLGKLFDLSERWEKNRAAERFADAITAFQRECPQIEKRKEGTQGAFKYAPYEEVMAVAGPIMVRHAIVATFTSEDTEKGLRVTCRIRVGMHCEETTLDVSRPVGNKMTSEPQLDGINLSYAKRYALCASLNIVCRDEDKDGADMRTLSEPQIAELCPLVEALEEAGGLDMKKFLEWAQADKVKAIHPRVFPDALRFIKKAIAQNDAARAILAEKMKAGEP